MPLSESSYKKRLFDKVEKSLQQIGDINTFLAPIDNILSNNKLDENSKMLQIENYVNKNFPKFAGIEEVRKSLKIEAKDYSKGL